MITKCCPTLSQYVVHNHPGGGAGARHPSRSLPRAHTQLPQGDTNGRRLVLCLWDNETVPGPGDPRWQLIWTHHRQLTVVGSVSVWILSSAKDTCIAQDYQCSSTLAMLCVCVSCLLLDAISWLQQNVVAACFLPEGWDWHRYWSLIFL